MGGRVRHPALITLDVFKLEERGSMEYGLDAGVVKVVLLQFL